MPKDKKVNRKPADFESDAAELEDLVKAPFRAAYKGLKWGAKKVGKAAMAVLDHYAEKETRRRRRTESKKGKNAKK